MNILLSVLSLFFCTCALASQEQFDRPLFRPILSLASGNDYRANISFAYPFNKYVFPRLLFGTNDESFQQAELSNIVAFGRTEHYGFYGFGSAVVWHDNTRLHDIDYFFDLNLGLGSYIRLPYRFAWWTEVYTSADRLQTNRTILAIRTGAGFTF